jgi:hypothetical protein
MVYKLPITSICYFLISDSPNLGGRFPYLYLPWNRVVQLYPRALGSLFVASYDSQVSGRDIVTRLHNGYTNYSF